MADISKLSIGGTQYSIKDTTARTGVSTNATAIKNLESDAFTFSDTNIENLVTPSSNNIEFSLFTGGNSSKELIFRLPAATTEKAGLLTAADKKKVDKIDTITKDIAGGMHFIGTTSTLLTDGATASTLVEKSNKSLTKTTGFIAGDMVIYNKSEFVWTGSSWALFGDLSSLGSLAYKNSASGNLPSSSHAHTFTGTAHSHTATVSGGGVTGSCVPSGIISIKDSHLANGSFMKVFYNPTGSDTIEPKYLVAQDQLSTTTLRGVGGTASITPFGSAGTLPSGNTVVSKVNPSATTVSVANEILTIPASVITGVSYDTTNALKSTGTLPTAGNAVTVATANSNSTTVATYTNRATSDSKWIDLPNCLSASFTGITTQLSLTHTNPTVSISNTTAGGTIASANAYAAGSTVSVS